MTTSLSKLFMRNTARISLRDFDYESYHNDQISNRSASNSLFLSKCENVSHEHQRSIPDDLPDISDIEDETCEEILMNHKKNSENNSIKADTQDKTQSDIQTEVKSLAYGVNLNVLRPEIAKLFKEKRRLMDELIDVNTGGWKKPIQTKPLIIWGKNHPDYLMIRSEVEIDASLEKVERYMRDPAFMATVDVKREFERKIRDESSCCELIHFGLKGEWPISPRDMVTYRFYYYTDKDTMQILNFNAEDLNMPPIKGTVRTDLKLHGGCLNRSGPHKTKFIVVVMVNPKIAGIPMFIIRTKLSEAAMVSYHLKVGIENAEKSCF